MPQTKIDDSSGFNAGLIKYWISGVTAKWGEICNL